MIFTWKLFMKSSAWKSYVIPTDKTVVCVDSYLDYNCLCIPFDITCVVVNLNEVTCDFVFLLISQFFFFFFVDSCWGFMCFCTPIDSTGVVVDSYRGYMLHSNWHCVWFFYSYLHYSWLFDSYWEYMCFCISTDITCVCVDSF